MMQALADHLRGIPVLMFPVIFAVALLGNLWSTFWLTGQVFRIHDAPTSSMAPLLVPGDSFLLERMTYPSATHGPARSHRSGSNTTAIDTTC